jgi:hypothetical protein
MIPNPDSYGEPAPDHVIDHVPPSCAACGSAMTLEMTVGHSARQVFDLPAPAADDAPGRIVSQDEGRQRH